MANNTRRVGSREEEGGEEAEEGKRDRRWLGQVIRRRGCGLSLAVVMVVVVMW